MKRAISKPAVICALTIVIAAFVAPANHAAEIQLPLEAREAMTSIYDGATDAALPLARALQQKQPDHPLGYLLEAEAQWWEIYCEACQVKWGMFDDWAHGKKPSHDAYLALADKVIELAKRQIAKGDTAEMHVYAGLGWGLKARVYDERDDHRNVARSGVAARAEFLRALEIDPDTPDAIAGLGLYNYYVDTLSPVVKLLRFFMGIPGGNKQEGIRQMQRGMEHGVLFDVDARYYLAKNLRTFDLHYEQALGIAHPLVEQYPHNAIFQLLAGNLNAELGRKDVASEHFHNALAATISDSACAERIKSVANTFLGENNSSPAKVF